jgi:hypothetical protein
MTRRDWVHLLVTIGMLSLAAAGLLLVLPALAHERETPLRGTWI